MEKSQSRFCGMFLPLLTKYSFLGEDCTLGYISIKFWDFFDIPCSCFPKIQVSLNIPYLSLLMTLGFTCGERKLAKISKSLKYCDHGCLHLFYFIFIYLFLFLFFLLFLCLFMSLWTAPIVKNSLETYLKTYFGWNLLYLSKKRGRPSLKIF